LDPDFVVPVIPDDNDFNENVNFSGTKQDEDDWAKVRQS